MIGAEKTRYGKALRGAGSEPVACPVACYDFQARHYDPDVGQFLQIDPLVPDPFTPADLNPYGYVRNDPVNGVDPTGEELISFLVALGFLAVTDAGLALGTTGVVVGTLATVGTAVGIHHATSPESYERPRDSVPPVGWLQVAEASLETAQGRSVATRTASRSGYCPGGYDCNVSRDGVLTS